MNLLRRITAGWQWFSRAVRESLFWTLLMRQRVIVRWLVTTLILSAVIDVLIAQAVVAMVDDAIVDQAVPLADYVRQIALLAVVRFAVGFLNRQLTVRLSYHMEFELRTWLYSRIQGAELQRLQSVSNGQYVTRSMTDVHLIQEILQYLPVIVGLAPVILGLGIFVLIISPPMGVLALAALPLNLGIVSRFRKRLSALSFADLYERSEVAGAIDEPVRGIRVVKAFSREARERARVRATTDRAFRLNMSRVRLLARYDIPIKAGPVLVNAAVLFIGARLVASDSLSLGEFLIAFQVAGGITILAQLFDELAGGWQYLRSAQTRVASLLALGRRPREGRALPTSATGVALRGVDIAYDDHVVLAGVDLEVRPGELVVLTGPPRSGKSAVAQVAAGLLEPAAGEVVLDGLPIGLIDVAAVRRSVRVAVEEPMLFTGTFRSNLDLGAPWPTSDEEIRAAARAAGADEVIASFPDGLDSPVGERGLTLSGGQRQRLALARSLVVPPRVLILDDALSAVNPSLELQILRRIRAHAPDMAILCITRREGPAALADRVVELPAPAAARLAEPAPTAAMVEAQRMAAVSAEDDEPPYTEEEVTRDERPRFAWLLRRIRPIVLAVLAVMLVNGVARLGPELLFGQVSDVAVDRGDTGLTDLISLAAVGVGAAYALSGYPLRVLTQRAVQGMVFLLRRRTFERLMRLGIDYYDRERPGLVAARVVNDLDRFSGFALRAVSLLSLLSLFFIAMAIVLIISAYVFPVVLGIVLVLVVITVAQLRIGSRAYGEARTQLGLVVAKFEEDLAGTVEIRSCGAVAKANRRFVTEAWELRHRRKWALSVENFFQEATQFVAHVGGALVLWRAGWSVWAGGLAVGSALVIRLVTTQGMLFLPQVNSSYGRLLDVRVSWRRLAEPFGAPLLPVERPDARPCPPLRGEVGFDGVSFGYPGTGREVLHDVSFTIPPGTVTALVGYTGAGKSSIAKLLARMYDPDAGAVRLDGHDIRDLDVASLRHRLGIVPQDAFVFRGTVGSNIAYARPEATDEEIEEAARVVGAWDVLQALPGGLDHPVEEEGANLTAAQRQLIAFARAWLVEPDILVLDEATSSLDAALEDQVLRTIARLGRTTIMITHRDNVARAADRVLVLSDGRLVEEGTPEELAGAGSAYDGLWHADPDAFVTA